MLPLLLDRLETIENLTWKSQKFRFHRAQSNPEPMLETRTLKQTGKKISRLNHEAHWTNLQDRPQRWQVQGLVVKEIKLHNT